MDHSILNTVKKLIGVDSSLTVFDLDILIHINSTFARLHQLGIGPVDGFMIEDAVTTWDAFLGDGPLLNQAKSYVYLSVRILFDPPQTSYLIDAMDKQIMKMEWLLNVVREEDSWTNPSLPV